MLHIVHVNMNILILICLLCYLRPISGDEDNTDAYCFKFTWPGPMYTNNKNNNTCTSGYDGVPCVNPIQISTNTTDIWEKWQQSSKKIGPDSNICVLRNGYTCIKYSYIYNNAVLNSSHYCGKIIEDKTVAITSGCFYYEVDGHIIEVCACRSTPGSMPCNIGTQHISSFIMLFTTVVTLLYNLLNK